MMCDYYKATTSQCLRPAWDAVDSPYCVKHTTRYLNRIIDKYEEAALATQ